MELYELNRASQNIFGMGLMTLILLGGFVYLLVLIIYIKDIKNYLYQINARAAKNTSNLG